MTIKYKAEWPKLVQIAKKYNLEDSQIIILLAIREVEDGTDGNEFRRLVALGNGLDAQATACAKEIKLQELYYNAVLKKESEKDGDFVGYLYRTDTDKIERIREYITLITNEFDAKEKL